MQAAVGAARAARARLAVGLLFVVTAANAESPTFPNMGIHDGDNKIVWESGCCDGDLVIIDFRDEMGDGNQGSGLLRLANNTRGDISTYEVTPFWGMWKTFGPYCAPAGTHTFSFTSDAESTETTFSIIDSFGLVKARGGMDDLPVTFNTTAPSKFCADAPLPFEVARERALKVMAYSLQFHSREELIEQGLEGECPYDKGYSVLPPRGDHVG